MPLLSRIVVIVAAFLAAAIVAGIVITIGVLVREWDDLVAITDPHVAWWMAAFFAFIVGGAGFVPAFLVIVFAEGYRVRSVLFYAATGGLGLVALYYGFGFATHGLPAGREVEIMAGAGIAAGFVYWMIAGRNAGKWRELGSDSASAHARESGHPGSLKD
jgi:hypothetical protein